MSDLVNTVVMENAIELAEEFPGDYYVNKVAEAIHDADLETVWALTIEMKQELADEEDADREERI